MPAPSWERLDDFLQLGDFAVTAMIRAGGSGVPRPVVGILDDPYQAARAGAGSRERRSEYEIDSAKPTFRCKLVDVAAVRRGDTIEHGGETWDVLTGPQDDGTGLAMLELAKRHA